MWGVFFHWMRSFVKKNQKLYGGNLIEEAFPTLLKEQQPLWYRVPLTPSSNVVEVVCSAAGME
jgi:hypothetical protein